MIFLTLSGANVDFLNWEFRRKIYTTKEALLTTRCIELVGKKEFAVTAFDSEHETYVVHIGSVSSIVLPNFSLLELNVHLFHRPKISGLVAEKTLIKVLAKYSDFANIFSSDLISKLPEHTKINDYAIKLVDG